VAYALVRAASRLVSMPVPGGVKTPGVDTSVDAARLGARATKVLNICGHYFGLTFSPASNIDPYNTY
jgi:hypothetical protein